MADRCDIGFKQKAVIEFLAFEGNAAKEISGRLQNVYGDSALSYTSVKRWVTHFKSGGSSSITDKPRSGRPSTAVTEENRTLVDELIRSDGRITVREIVERIGTGHNAAQNIISELGYSKVYGGGFRAS